MPPNEGGDAAEVPSLLRQPEGVVPLGMPVTILWSPGLFLEDEPKVSIEDRIINTVVEHQPNGVRLLPAPRWPSNATVTVDLGGLATASSVEADGWQVVFNTDWDESEGWIEPEVMIRRPVPSSVAPSNLKWLAVAGVDPLVSELVLRSAEGYEVRARSEDKRWGPSIFDVLDGACAAPCAPQRLRLVVPDRVALGPRGEVLTGSVPDLSPPVLRHLGVEVVPGRLEIAAVYSEIVRVRGLWRHLTGVGGARMVAVGLPSHEVRLRQEGQPPRDVDIYVEIIAEDLGGQVVTTSTVVRTPPPLSLRIQELVPTPRRDWGDSEPNGQPFDPWPGWGTVSSADEWIELVNDGNEILRLQDLGLQIRVKDNSPSVTLVATAPALWWGDGGSLEAWYPGEALVVRPLGAMDQRGLRVELWAGEIEVDALWVAAIPGAHHPGGQPPDWVHESIARSADGQVRWCRPTPGNPLPTMDCVSE